MRRPTILTALILVALPLAAGGKTPPEPDLPRLGVALQGDRAITLDRAIDIARGHSAGLALTRSNSLYEKGVAREAGGLFDDRLELTIDAEKLRGELIPAGIRQQLSTRSTFNIFATVFQRVADNLQNELDSDPNFSTIPCSEDFGQGSEIVIIDADGNELIIRCTPVDEPTAIDDILDTIAGSGNNPGLDEAIKEYQAYGTDTSRTEIEKVINIFNLNASSMRDNLRNFGVAPTIETRLGFTVSTGYNYALRNGMSWAPRIAFQSLDTQFEGKGRDPQRGGKGPVVFKGAVGIELNVPLGRGGGLGIADALERSALRNYTASLAGVSHAETATVLSTAFAYWSLLAAQDRLDAAEEASSRSEQLLSIGREMADADEIASADLNQFIVQAGENRRNYLASRQAFYQAQLSLANVIGLEVNSYEELPTAVGQLPDVVAPSVLRTTSVDSLISEAMTRRNDLAEAFGRVEAADALTFAARESLEPTVNLTFFVAYQSTDKNFSYRDGLNDIVFGKWFGPAAGVTVKVELPFENRFAIGQYRQSLALQRQSQIQARDLQRTTASRVAELWGSLIEIAEIVTRYENSEKMYRQALADEVEKFKKGEGTVLDSIFVQEQLTRQQLIVVEARLQWATTLAQLRFETGTIANPDFGKPMSDLLATPPTLVDNTQNEMNSDPVERLADDLKKAQTTGRMPLAW